MYVDVPTHILLYLTILLFFFYIVKPITFGVLFEKQQILCFDKMFCM